MRHSPGAGRDNSQGGRARLGCMGSLFVSIGAILVVYLGLYPWAFNIGGHFTPWTVWTGYGKLQSSTGATYGLYVRFWLTPYHGRGGGTSGGDNLRGNAVLCTPKGINYTYDLRGNVKNAWTTTEGKSTYLYLNVPKDEKSIRGFDLVGVWRNGQLVLDDKGSMRLSFQPDGSVAPKGWVTRSPSPEHASVTLAYGEKDAFDAICASHVTPGR
ncbi:MAG TPA: hypothetical protein VI488_02960 [Candidatus Angelobacter sp.]